MKPSPIRELAGRYAAGELSLDEYRAQRRRLIDAVTNGGARLEYRSARRHRPVAARARWFILLPVLVLVAAGITAFVWFGHIHSLYQINMQVVIPQNTGPRLVHAFVETNDWNDANVEQFRQHWNQLSASERTAARQDYLFPQLISQLREQIVSQQAMLELAPNRRRAARHLTHLRQLANLLKTE